MLIDFWLDTALRIVTIGWSLDLASPVSEKKVGHGSARMRIVIADPFSRYSAQCREQPEKISWFIQSQLRCTGLSRNLSHANFFFFFFVDGSSDQPLLRSRHNIVVEVVYLVWVRKQDETTSFRQRWSKTKIQNFRWILIMHRSLLQRFHTLWLYRQANHIWLAKAVAERQLSGASTITYKRGLERPAVPRLCIWPLHGWCLALVSRPFAIPGDEMGVCHEVLKNRFSLMVYNLTLWLTKIRGPD